MAHDGLAGGADLPRVAFPTQPAVILAERGRMHWYKFHIADFEQKTADLTLTQKGAYLALLNAYYQREAPLPADMGILYRICHAHHRKEQEAVRMVLNRFFTAKNGHYLQSRADQEVEQYQRQCSANRRPNRTQNLREIERDKELTSKPVDNFQEKNPKPRKLDDYLYTTHQEALRRIKTPHA